MHLDLKDMNRILEQTGSEKGRHELVAHLVDCPKCARRFRILHQLHQEHKQPARKARFVVFAAAAAIFFAVTGMFISRTPTISHQATYTQASIQVSPEMDLLSEIQRVNMKDSFPDWGKTENMMDLVKKTRS